MSNKFSNKKLGVVFVVLLVLTIIFIFTDGKKERSFRTELVEIDTASVDEILIYPKTTNYKEVKLFKDDADWKVLLEDGSSVTAPKSKIDNLLSSLLKVKPNRLAARGSEKWKEFEVTDSLGTRVKVVEDGDVTLDIILGRFAFQQPRTMNTFVRLYNDTDVYEVDGFLSATFNQNADNYRDNSVITGDHNNWTNLTFKYPGDSSFALVKMNDMWFLNDEPTDSTETVKTLRSLERLSNTNFVDASRIPQNSNPQYKVTIQGEMMEDIVVNGFQADSIIVVNSSLNSESYFDATKNNFTEKIFPSQKKFFK
jgi:hypothetical protein